jgi:hypothetical protein
MKVPILGVEGSGKTTFAWGIGRTLIDRGWGKPTDEARAYFAEIDPCMLMNQPPAATVGKRSLAFLFQKCQVEMASPEQMALSEMSSQDADGDLPDHEWVEHSADWTTATFKADLVISSYDISGGDFTRCMSLFTHPVERPEADPDFGRFADLMRESDGLIVMIDLARRIRSRAQFLALSEKEQSEHILRSLAEQVGPVCHGIEMVLRLNSHMHGKPVIFGFTKADIHGRDEEWVERLLFSACATMIGVLRDRGVSIYTCCLAYEGRRLDVGGNLYYCVKGVDILLTRLLVGLLESRLDTRR